MRWRRNERQRVARAHAVSRVLAPLLVAIALGTAAPLHAQVQAALVAPPLPARPFQLGERLEYRVRVSGVGMTGHGAMWVDGPEQLRGIETYVLHFGFKARVGPVRVSDATRSWLDPRRMASLRFTKSERHPFGSSDEDVSLYPAEKRWSSADGGSGQTMTDAPLDELSFIYFLRTVPLADGTVYTYNRHFDATRNPTTVFVVRREPLTTTAGTFATVLVEMQVKDPARYRGDGVIRIHFSDDERRLPLRIETTIPRAGRAVLTLESVPAVIRSPFSSRPDA